LASSPSATSSTSLLAGSNQHRLASSAGFLVLNAFKFYDLETLMYLFFLPSLIALSAIGFITLRDQFSFSRPR
jgi:hypothetical protein